MKLYLGVKFPSPVPILKFQATLWFMSPQMIWLISDILLIAMGFLFSAWIFSTLCVSMLSYWLCSESHKWKIYKEETKVVVPLFLSYTLSIFLYCLTHISMCEKYKDMWLLSVEAKNLFSILKRVLPSIYISRCQLSTCYWMCCDYHGLSLKSLWKLTLNQIGIITKQQGFQVNFKYSHQTIPNYCTFSNSYECKWHKN
jgi:hypothetical protein